MIDIFPILCKSSIKLLVRNCHSRDEKRFVSFFRKRRCFKVIIVQIADGLLGYSSFFLINDVIGTSISRESSKIPTNIALDSFRFDDRPLSDI